MNAYYGLQNIASTEEIAELQRLDELIDRTTTDKQKILKAVYSEYGSTLVTDLIVPNVDNAVICLPVYTYINDELTSSEYTELIYLNKDGETISEVEIYNRYYSDDVDTTLEPLRKLQSIDRDLFDTLFEEQT